MRVGETRIMMQTRAMVQNRVMMQTDTGLGDPRYPSGIVPERGEAALVVLEIPSFSQRFNRLLEK
jgi:hypothetical protein